MKTLISHNLFSNSSLISYFNNIWCCLDSFAYHPMPESDSNPHQQMSMKTCMLGYVTLPNANLFSAPTGISTTSWR